MITNNELMKYFYNFPVKNIKYGEKIKMINDYGDTRYLQVIYLFVPNMKEKEFIKYMNNSDFSDFFAYDFLEDFLEDNLSNFNRNTEWYSYNEGDDILDYMMFEQKNENLLIEMAYFI